MAQEQNNQQDNQQQSNEGNTFNSPKIGMNLDASPIDLSPLEYSLALNANIQSADGSLLKITNEPSNLLCSKFKPGYQVIGRLYVPTQKITIYFLVNTISNQSEIGYIKNVVFDDNSDWQATCKNCNNPLVESIPLEQILQSEGCFYQTIVNSPCLNFNINYPVDALYEIGINVDTQQPDCDNITIFFTDNLNPRRYLNINNWPQEIVGFNSNNCNQPIYNGLLDCNQILVDKNYTDGCILATQIIQGGQNTAGTYQIAAAYSNSNGNSISDYFIVSNPINIWDSKNVITTNTDYKSGQAIQVNISNIDTDFLYLNLVVIKTINGITRAFLIGTFPINSNSFLYTYTGNSSIKEIELTLNEILDRRTHYTKAKGLMSSNDILFSYNLSEQRIINLQPVVNNLKLQWQTVEVSEGTWPNTFYSNGTNVANYLGYERDEVYALGIEFRLNTGYKLPTFLLSSLNMGEYQNITGISPSGVINNSDVLSNPLCCNPSGCQLNELWQVYNIATNNGIGCNYISPSSGTSITTQTQYCTSLYNDGTSPSSCCPVDSTNCQISGDPVLVSPSGTQITNLYSNNPVVYQPDMVTDLPTSWIPSGCSPVCSGTCCLQQVNLYNATNNTPQLSLNLLSSSNTVCALGLNTGNTSLNPPIFFKYTNNNIPITSTFCGTQNAANKSWYSFTATNIVQAITIYPFLPVPVTIIVYSDFGITEIACNSGTTGAYLVLQNLTLGNNYYFVVFTPDPTFSNLVLQYGQIQWLFGTICINTPNPIGTTTINIPAVFSQTYSYTTTGNTNILNTIACELQTYQFGEFSYWQSSLNYPSNSDVWGDLCGQPIRHFKFPDCAISHIHDNPLINGYGVINKIYPLGIRLDIIQIKTILEEAVSKNLITEAEKLSITGYSIKRGNRRTNRSIQAKGFLTDVWRTPLLQLDYSKGTNASWLPVLDNHNQPELVYYPNYVFNDNSGGFDPWISSQQNVPFSPMPIFAPYHLQGSINGRYTFHSPNTSFNQPFLIQGQELKLETAENGYTSSGMNEVLFHSKYVLLSKKAYILAEALAQIEIAFDATIAAMGFSANFLGTGGSVLGFVIGFAISEVVGITLNSGKYTSQWADIFQKLGTPQNPAIYYVGNGRYNGYTPVLNAGITRKRALIENSQYLQAGNFQFSENGQIIRFNNFERESSVYLSTDAFTSTNITPNIDPTKAFQPTFIFGNNFKDTSKTDAYNNYFNNCSTYTTYTSTTPNIASYYASIKNYVPDQYGTVDQIEWLDTGYCGVINWSDSSQSNICNTIFGGDTFLNRFAYKEKMPLFTDDRVYTNTTTINTDIFYQNLGNIGYPNFFFNSQYDILTGNAGSSFFGFTPPTTQFLCNQNTFFYQRGNFPLYFYSIPYFICESDYNVDLRYGEDQLAKNFYPNVGDVVNWTQQYQVPISQDNYYFYNNDYSKQNKENFAYILNFNFSNLTDICQTYHPTRVIYSPQGTQFWLNTLSADFYDFAREDGDIIKMKELEELKVLVLQEQCNKIFNAFVTMQTNAGIVQVSSAKGIFQDNKPSQIYSTDLGYAGCQSRETVSTPYGTFYIDTRNPAILSVTRTMYGRNVTNDILEPKEGKSKVKLWFRQNLPFNIIKDYPTVDIDNAYKYFGITTCWDNRYDRLFITKRDARVKPEFKNQIIYSSDLEFYLVTPISNIHILPTNSKYFDDKSWTIGLNPTLGHEFISFYSFIPNYYNSTESYFQSGYNFPIDNNLNELGLWTHNLTQRSYQVFQGNLYPFMFEYVTKTTPQNIILNNVNYQSEFQRYQKDLNWYTINRKTYNKAIIHSQNQSSGLLNLVVVEKDNLFQLINYPQYNIDSSTILVENVTNFFSFNTFNNIGRLNGQALMIYTPDNVMYKDINNLAVNYTPQYLPNKLKGDYFNIRLINDLYSNYKIIHKHSIQKNTNSI